MTLIERVAKAIQQQQHSSYEAQAIAAIKAMRQPTLQMLPHSPLSQLADVHAGAISIWKIMIDAVLKPVGGDLPPP